MSWIFFFLMLSYRLLKWRVKQRGPQIKGELFDKMSELRVEISREGEDVVFLGGWGREPTGKYHC